MLNCIISYYIKLHHIVMYHMISNLYSAGLTQARPGGLQRADARQ